MADYSCFKVLALSGFLKHVLDPVPNHVSTKDAIIIFLPILTIFLRYMHICFLLYCREHQVSLKVEIILLCLPLL